MTVKSMTKRVVTFRDSREWKQFHSAKDCALSLLIEASEYAQLLQFKTAEQLQGTDKTEHARELADVLYWVLLIAHDQGIDLEQAFTKKMRENERKYPIKKFKGSNRKYRM